MFLYIAKHLIFEWRIIEDNLHSSPNEESLNALAVLNLEMQLTDHSMIYSDVTDN